MKNIAIFASGSGSNAQKIIEHFAASDVARVTLVLANNPAAYVLDRARAAGVEAVVFDRAQWRDDTYIINRLREAAIDYIVLAGFLWLVPPALVAAYPGRIVNIHPALLPKYGGKGMYGHHVHEAVIAAGERESGITIHLVNEVYDSGDILAQLRVAVTPDDTPDTLAAKIHVLEHRHFPQVIEEQVRKL
ncbi:MAG: phosphoribosylglycinamide formyltransferase [Rikenellaceae bacterium]|jgi:phosphoribosylglycinamide formyltransferase-1|nr:phosphoribosylglycinamide formyltransferase [Rikenellaceae bacterium]